MEDYEFNVQIKYTSRKGSIGLRVHADGVCLLAPHRTPIDTLSQLMRERQHWVREQLAQLKRKRPETNQPRLKNGCLLPYLGKEHLLVITAAPKRRVFLDGDTLQVETINSTPLPPLQQCRQLLEQWYLQQAIRYLDDKLQYWSLRTNLSYQSLKVRSYKSRWGSCDRLKRITLNSRLMMAPEPVIEYVIIHELCHLQHLNHSAEFWTLVERYCPDYQQHRRWLRSHDAQLRLPE